MTQPQNKPSAFNRLARSMAVALERARDLASFQSARFDAIENRLAVLDGGHDAASARGVAYARANEMREEEGRRPLGFRLVGSQLEWNTPETRVSETRR